MSVRSVWRTQIQQQNHAQQQPQHQQIQQQQQQPAVMEEVLSINTTGKNGAGDHFIEITVSEPQKNGDGMGSYILYKYVFSWCEL